VEVRWLVAAAFVLFVAASPAHAATPAGVEHIERFTVDMDVARDGLLSVHEEIVYDLGTVPHHGILRDIPVRETYGNDGRYERVYRVHLEGVTAENAPDGVKTSKEGAFLRIRIGDPDRTITGVHRYTIDYTVEGALTGFGDHDELFWDAIGTLWPVTIDAALIRVTMPADITRVACFTGPEGSRLSCDRAAHRGTTATFNQGDLGTEEGVTVVAGIPAGVITPPPEPILEKRWNIVDAFAPRPDTVAPAAALALAGVGGVIWLGWRKGRDRRYHGSAVDQAFGNTTGTEEAVPLFGRRAGPVEFVPPDGVRPGEVGVLADENANLLDVTATIVDLAVREYLTITELEPEGFLFKRHDYELHALDVDAAKQAELLPYEQKILDGLFATGSTVKLSELKYKFRDELSGIRRAMYDDAVEKGWYRARPDSTRAIWHGIGIAVIVVGAGLTFLVARYTSYGLVPLAVVIAGIVLLASANAMPARTGRGSAMLSRIRGFRRLFDEGDEDLRSRFAEQHNIFSEYLPYAIVFGCTAKWARAFEGLDAEQLGTTSWYGGHANLNALVLASALDDFGTTATGTLYASQPSSSGGSGFGGGGSSGGGGGGGGGGSW
jgi:hypothetical protein